MDSYVCWPGQTAKVAPLGFGCCPMGGHGWGKTEEKQLVDAVSAALDLGVTFFDTADIYGLGTSESVLGAALQNKREKAFIATKFGVRFENGRSFHDTSIRWINQALEDSLRRLRTDWIDLYQMHYWDGATALEEIVAELEKLVARGKIRSYGITNFDPGNPALGGASGSLASYSYQYSLVDRDREVEILSVQQNSPLIFLSWGSLGQGVLAGKYSALSQLDPTDRRQRPVYKNFHGSQFRAIQALLAQMKVIAAEMDGVSLTQLSLRWIIDRIPRSLPLVGIKRSEQIIDAAGALKFHLDSSVSSQLDHLAAHFLNATPSL